MTIRSEPIDSDDARYALDRYSAELDELFPGGFDTGRAAPPAPGDFSPPAGEFLMVRVGGAVAGCGAVRKLSDGVAEIRRMWLDPSRRGLGLGRKLMSELERRAEELGCHTVRLDTAAQLDAAKALYRRSGYTEIPAYNDNPYAKHWFEKPLGTAPGATD